MLKAETEFKTAVGLDPDSEEAVTMLAYLYNEEGAIPTQRSTKVLSSLCRIPPGVRQVVFLALGYTYEQQKQYKAVHQRLP